MQRAKYKYLPHTADIAFVAYGKSAEKAIENSAEALLNVMLDLKRVKKAAGRTATTTVKESADSLENLVWYTLQDILTKIDEKKLRAYGFRVKSFSERNLRLTGELLYKKMKEDPFLLEVKAVTPEGLAVKKGKNGYEIRILLDV
jgi:SHS2 domain-containing protein